MTSYVENETSITFDFDIKEVLDQVMEQVLAMEDCPYEAQVNLLITDDDGIRGFNREYRQIDAPTDVLSFPQYQAGESLLPHSSLGDIVISLPKMAEQAAAYGHAQKRELIFLFVHGLLHLLGYDHEISADEERRQFARQDEVLAALKISR